MTESASNPKSQFGLPTLGERRNLRQEVAHALRAALIAGEMRPGELYSAPALAARFGISATPVREAMLDLVNEGLVEVARNKGFRIAEVSDAELDNITHLRELIEVPLVGLVAANLNKATRLQVEGLRSLADEIVDRAAATDFIGYIEADRKFHLGLLALAGNDHAVQVVGNLRARSRLYGLRELAAKGRLDRSAREHHDIVDAVLAGDEAAATQVMKRHIGHVRGVWAGHAERELDVPGQDDGSDGCSLT